MAGAAPLSRRAARSFIAPPADRCVGTAGAGDAFASTFVALTALGWPLNRALKAASINSASVVRHADTQSGLLTLAEIEERVEGDEALHMREWPMEKG